MPPERQGAAVASYLLADRNVAGAQHAEWAGVAQACHILLGSSEQKTNAVEEWGPWRAATGLLEKIDVDTGRRVRISPHSRFRSTPRHYSSAAEAL